MKLRNKTNLDVKIMFKGEDLVISAGTVSKDFDAEQTKYLKQVYDGFFEEMPNKIEEGVEDEGTEEIENAEEAKEEVTQPIEEVKVLREKYLTKFGKRIVGKWSNDIDWMKAKLNS